MKAKRHLIYLGVGALWFGVAFTLQVAALQMNRASDVADFMVAGGLVVFVIIDIIEAWAFFSYLSAWDPILLGQYAAFDTFNGIAAWGVKRLSFTSEDNGDPELQEHKAILRVTSLIVAAALLGESVVIILGPGA